MTCSWSTIATLNTFNALTPPRDQESPRRKELDPIAQSHLTIPDIPSLVKTPLVLPESHLLQRLFQIFFDRHHEAELCSFFHKPSLDIPNLHDRSPLLVASVISLAALYISADEAKTDFGFETPCAFSDHYNRLAKSYAYGLSDEPCSK